MEMSMKVLFLDIDGVLNSRFWSNANEREISNGKFIES
jgi:histidinol phosphatase-like enzyme